MIHHKPLLEAAQGKKTNQIPLWFMRQAGRYLPEYQEIKKRHNTLTMFQTPAIASEITLQPLKRFNLSAAILYADILLISDAMGLELSFVEKQGPRFAKTIRSPQDLQSILPHAQNLDALIQKLSYVAETIALTKPKLSPQTTFLGFAGAPFTVASYMIEGGSSLKGEFLECKKLMFRYPQTFHALMDLLTEATIAYLKMQINAGVEAVQLFESWSGALSVDQFQEYCLASHQRIISEIKKHVPIICFLGQGAALLPEVPKINPNVYSVDWRQDLANVSEYLKNYPIALQGNLDPLLLYAPQEILQKHLEKCLKIGTKHPHGFIFNLGHGVTPQTPIKSLEFLVHFINHYHF